MQIKNIIHYSCNRLEIDFPCVPATALVVLIKNRKLTFSIPSQSLLVMSGILILIGITTSGAMFLIALGGSVVLYALILKLYLRTAQDLKRLEGISKFDVVARKDFFRFRKRLSCSGHRKFLCSSQIMFDSSENRN